MKELNYRVVFWGGGFICVYYIFLYIYIYMYIYNVTSGTQTAGTATLKYRRGCWAARPKVPPRRSNEFGEV